MTTEKYQAALAIGAVAVFFSNLSNYLFRGGVASIQPYWWIVGWGLLALPIAARVAFTSGIQVPPLAVWCYGFGLVSIAWFFRATSQATADEELQVRLLSIAFLLVALFVFSSANARQRARQATAIAVIVGVVINLYELFHPETFSDVLGRSAGLYMNPTQSGMALVLGMVIGLGAVDRRYRLLFMLVAGLGVLTTFSRAPILGWIIAVGLGCAAELVRHRRLAGLVEVGLVGTAVAAFMLSPGWTAVQDQLEDQDVLNDNVIERIGFLTLRGGGDDSSDERIEVAALAWDALGARPFAGSGTGAAAAHPFEVGPHNMYLALGVEHGVMGLVIFPALIIACIWGVGPPDRMLALTFAIVLAFLAFFSHNLLSERYALVSYALMASIAAGGRSGRASAEGSVL